MSPVQPFSVMDTMLLCLGLVLCSLCIPDPVTGQCSGVDQARAPIYLRDNGYNLLIGVDESVTRNNYPDLVDRIKVRHESFYWGREHLSIANRPLHLH